MGESAAEQGAAAAGPSFEESVTELEGIIDRIERGEIGLEESLRAFRRGDELVRRCRAILDQAEQEVREISLAAIESGGGEASGERNLHDDGDDDESGPASRGDSADRGVHPW
ncbi:MAG TPA: exodeoxyribonuclease VII small subunit [Phycisphaerales bacterium]|nr:exodeoxyribonuclease VII small subunit [Phycisphaerales bacterium]HMP36559.1 exodeoxyribonuclease VII small subunit [Phycisphaerales bacterium]